METDVGAIAEGQQILSGDDVMEAQFKLQEATENGEPPTINSPLGSPAESFNRLANGLNVSPCTNTVVMMTKNTIGSSRSASG